MSELATSLQSTLDHLPKKPGVYLMKGKKGEILYIGKARVLTDRVRSYFQKGADQSPKTRVLVGLVQDIETIVTKSELEALLLESNMVKRHRPRFNVVLRDDKHYPYLRLPVKDNFPRLSIVRRVKHDGAMYFGPYVPTGALRDTLKIIKKVFPLATCKIDIDGTADRACIEFEIKRCMAPCTGHQSQEDYHRIVQQVRYFLEGRDKELLDGLRAEMEAASNREEFEEAARLRDRMANIAKTLEKQRIAQIGPVDQDVMGLARMGPAADLQLLFVRGGQLIGRKDFYWADTKESSDEELIRSAIEQFYNKDLVPPKEVLIPTRLGDREVMQQWLSVKKEQSVRILTPERGVKHQLLQLATENAVAAIAEHLRKGVVEEQEAKALQQLLHLPNPLGRIEGFDISNTMGTNSVASMVVWEDGKMKKADYRRFKVKTVEGANDFASMHEVVKRRYGGSLSVNEEKGLPFPDLILIDGGIGQLGAAMDALRDLGLKHVPIVGLAKAKGEKEERIYTPGVREPLILSPTSLASHLVQRIRDEAHRFAITYHRKLRGQALVMPSKTNSQKRTRETRPSTAPT
ncbi:excinuclease ABC subunit UvrC [Candidatus Nitronereus thalassa]|uniref:UvrABC system protein C n=1 Tax=Candidatus Nitronereus thalassa TaxID=3020898 RepID=A0ABU3KA73_9BACT|nr:excinuclease ABC subunit UvrC [Candidatus Nitronereus thalassa]MDT7043308.1 excinuclease ABC subunit UvrC [Candidatus Nitronereus thalassa]